MKPNTTQRSWSNYVGDSPIKRWQGREPIGESRFYADSPVYGPGGSAMQSAPEGYEIDPTTGGMRRKRSTRLNKARSDMGGTPVEGAYDPTTYVV